MFAVHALRGKERRGSLQMIQVRLGVVALRGALQRRPWFCVWGLGYLSARLVLVVNEVQARVQVNVKLKLVG